MIVTDGRYKIPEEVLEIVFHLDSEEDEEYYFINTDKRLIKVYNNGEEFFMTYEFLTDVELSIVEMLVRDKKHG